MVGWSGRRGRIGNRTIAVVAVVVVLLIIDAA